MTGEQKRWLSGVIRKYEQEAQKRYPMEDSDWEELQKSVRMIFEKSKKNPGVKKALVEFLLQCEKTDQEAERLRGCE